MDRIALLASDVGIEPSEPGCRPQVYIVFTVDAKELATYMVDNHWRVFRPAGDYLALNSLAQIDPNANPASYDSILNVFDNPAAYSGLTDWDRSYIAGLYTIDQERLPKLQRNVLVSAIARQERDSGR
jgi:hypothetical protein